MAFLMIVHIDKPEITGMMFPAHFMPALIFTDYASDINRRHVNLRGLYVIRKT